MKISYLIFVHKNFAQIQRLISNLNDEGVNFFIHISETGDAVYQECTEGFADFPNVHFIKNRFKIWWGTFSLVDAILSSVREIVYSGVDYERLVLLSGQDYPIKSNEFIRSFFIRNSDKNYIEYFSLSAPNKWTNASGYFNDKQRIENYYFTYRSKVICIPVKRKLPYSFTPYGGSLWWNLNKECIEYMIGFIENAHKFIDFMKHTYIPDEVFFQTLLLNSPMRSTIVNTDLRYINWEKANPTPPAVLMSEDFDTLSASTALFARKFDMDHDPKIFDLVDQNLLFLPAGSKSA